MDGFRGYHSLWELEPVITGWSICVCVMRVFKKFLGDGGFELGLVLADECGGRIEATIDRRFSDFYFGRIKENEWKTITTFGVRYNDAVVKAAGHESSIWFFDNTVVTNAMDRSPVDVFNFTQFDYIFEKTIDTNLLVDVVGALVEVGDLTNGFGGFKLQFKIKDRYKEVLECEAHGETAVDFDQSFRRYGRRKVVLALLWWKVTDDVYPKLVSHGTISKVLADPEIQEVDEIKMVVYE